MTSKIMPVNFINSKFISAKACNILVIPPLLSANLNAVNNHIYGFSIIFQGNSPMHCAIG